VRPHESLIVAIHCSDCGLEPGPDLALGCRGEARIEVIDWGEVVVDSNCFWYIALEEGEPIDRHPNPLPRHLYFTTPTPLFFCPDTHYL